MTTVLGIGHVLLGLVYLAYGAMTVADMVRAGRRLGFSHFGMAWVLMTMTCGPHHLEHGMHVLAGHTGHAADLVALAIGLPPGLVWFWLRLEAFRGGSGDRFVSGTPWWIHALPSAAAAYTTALVVLALDAGAAWRPELAPGIVLALLYLAVGVHLVRTQLSNRAPLGGWSVSGLSLAAVFPTCAAMHAVYVFFLATGVYAVQWHMLAIELVGIPATAYFLWVVRLLQTGRYNEWNVLPEPVPGR